MVKCRENLFSFKFLCAVLFFPPEKSLPVLLCILGAGHFLIYFAVKMSNMMKEMQEHKCRSARNHAESNRTRRLTYRLFYARIEKDVRQQ